MSFLSWTPGPLVQRQSLMSSPSLDLPPVKRCSSGVELIASVMNRVCSAADVQASLKPFLVRSLMTRQIPRDAMLEPPDPRVNATIGTNPLMSAAVRKLDSFSVNSPLGPVLLVPPLDNSPPARSTHRTGRG